jgi:hypothetical protein
MTMKTLAILGAGHGGCAAAADRSSRGYTVRLHARCLQFAASPGNHATVLSELVKPLYPVTALDELRRNQHRVLAVSCDHTAVALGRRPGEDSAMGAAILLLGTVARIVRKRGR